MNRFGWLILVLFFVGGVLLFRSVDQRKAPPQERQAATDLPEALPVPVAGVPPSALSDTWNQSRENGARAHQAVEKLHQSARGGLTAYVRDASGRWLTYYAHLAGYAAGLREGQAVAAGQPIGFVGDTGNAGAGNTHLHFALHRMQPGETWYQGTPVNPYPLLAGGSAAR